MRHIEINSIKMKHKQICQLMTYDGLTEGIEIKICSKEWIRYFAYFLNNGNQTFKHKGDDFGRNMQLFFRVIAIKPKK